MKDYFLLMSYADCRTFMMMRTMPMLMLGGGA